MSGYPMVRYAGSNCIGIKLTAWARRSSRSSASWTDMEKRKRPLPTFVLCIENSDYAVSLEKGKVYRTRPDRKAAALGLIRVRDESGAEYLYPKALFTAIKLPQAARRA